MTKATKESGGRVKGGGRAPLTQSTEETKGFLGRRVDGTSSESIEPTEKWSCVAE